MITLYDLPLEDESINEFYSLIEECCLSSSVYTCNHQMKLFNITNYKHRPINFNQVRKFRLKYQDTRVFLGLFD